TNVPGIDEEWIELYNRSTNSVDLGGWRLEDAVQFTFPADTVIAAGNYLVVARDAALLRLKYPAISILGDFSGQLPNDSGRVVLSDANENPANSVHYHDAKPWPEFADGGGASLELQNPFADNSVPEAWAASDETSHSAWQ